MEVAKVLRMNEGVGDSSYAQNSLLQKQVIMMTKPITEEAVTNLYYKISPKKLSIADLGCSSGPNALFAVSELIKIVEKICIKEGQKSPEYQVFLNDLPGNDFNTIFRSLNSFKDAIGGSSCFFTGVPGSFYGRLFPCNSLHFFHSSYSLMWLSQVPNGIEGNEGNIYMTSDSPPEVLKAYYNQFQKDFSLFLICRSKELKTTGRMVLTFLGRRSENPTSKECCYIWELLAVALNELASQGIIDKEKLGSFNIPQYTPSPSEVKAAIEKEGSFTINRLEASEVSWDVYHNQDRGYNVAKCMRAVAEPLLLGHFGFGKTIVDQIFRRYELILGDRMAKEKTTFVNVVASVTKRG